MTAWYSPTTSPRLRHRQPGVSRVLGPATPNLTGGPSGQPPHEPYGNTPLDHLLSRVPRTLLPYPPVFNGVSRPVCSATLTRTGDGMVGPLTRPMTVGDPWCEPC